MKYLFSAMIAGFLFGLGLCLSGMIDPRRVLGFLDVFGKWDSSLLWVMLGALVVVIPVFRIILSREKPVFASQFEVYWRQDIDRSLIGGAVLFGVGWGMSGICPGPAMTALVSGRFDIAAFVVAMLIGMVLQDHLFSRKTPR